MRLAATYLPLIAAVACLGLGAGCTTQPLSPPAGSHSEQDPVFHEALAQSKMMQYHSIGAVVVGVRPRELPVSRHTPQ